MRVYLPTTPDRLPGLRAEGLPAGSEGYAVTPALERALDLPADDPDTEDDLVDVVVGAAAEGSLLLLGEEAAVTGVPTGASGPAPRARRVVLVVEARARPVDDPDAHPATVVLSAPLRWSSVESVLADDETAADRVGRAALLVAEDVDRAVARLERDALGWFHPDEIGAPGPPQQARPVVAELSPDVHDELFDLRLERWLPDCVAGLREVYGAERAEATGARVVTALRQAHAARRPALRRHDQRRLLRPDWFQQPDMLGYAAYTDRFAGDLAGVGAKLDYLQELGVTYLHLLPLLTPREGDSDGGYAVADYRTVRADLGTNDDLSELADELHERGISLCVDLVLNHVAREHDWAVRARAGEQRYRDFFRLFGDRSGPDAYERTLPEVFPDFAPGSFTFDEELDAWVWTTFNSWQWDVDWSNPDVFVAYLKVVCHLANLGVDVLRLDAIAFLWKRLGTACQNEPEVHAITRALRAALRVLAPSVLLKAEAIVGPRDLVPYLGSGRHHGKVSDLAYHNSLMVQVWSMLAAQDVRLTVHALRRFDPVPTTTSWLTYLRCHDDIGWAVDDADAAAVGLDGHGHRSFLSDFYSGAFPGSFGRGLVFQHNEQTGDRRISGTAASLAGLDAALEQPDGPARRAAVDDVVARLLLAHAVIMGFGGIPVLWSGDELALRNDVAWAAEPGHEGDNRWAHRPRLPWTMNAEGEHAADHHDPGTVAGRVFQGLCRLAAARRGLVQLHASYPSEVLDPPDPGVLALLRRHPEGPMLGLYNVTGREVAVTGWLLGLFGLHRSVDVVSGEQVRTDDASTVLLAPYRALWLVRD